MMTTQNAMISPTTGVLLLLNVRIRIVFWLAVGIAAFNDIRSSGR